jgi:transcriptional regulator with XRE-family HTH domain
MPQRHQTLTRFGLNVRRRREAIGLSQEALAEKAELDRTYISGIERGTMHHLDRRSDLRAW